MDWMELSGEFSRNGVSQNFFGNLQQEEIYRMHEPE